MLTVENFKERLERSNRSDWLHVAVEVNNANQLYIVGNGGMGNTISMPIERYLPEIKEWVIRQINSGELIKDEKKSLLLDRNILVYYVSLPQFAKEYI
ncbi:MAG: hypothetical protein ACJAWS_000121 [Oleiphilaceae bacterium]|jgi:hypothetical protein|uniref:hypothetical protein n=1 Tax=Alteromonadales TaxID=135622 RepID=UPI000A16DC3B|nr:hypothetical protein [Colwellia polaris]|tara:strand:+ start:1870 stop:2163 length:294 start_codon:yes stop_codon:yes gene_type:complete